MVKASVVMAKIKLELNDIQGLIVRAHKELPEACYSMIHFEHSEGSRNWLQTIIQQITTATNKRPDTALQIAFTYSGIRFMVPKETGLSFSVEFTEGLKHPYRSRILGD